MPNKEMEITFRLVSRHVGGFCVCVPEQLPCVLERLPDPAQGIPSVALATLGTAAPCAGCTLRRPSNTRRLCCPGGRHGTDKLRTSSHRIVCQHVVHGIREQLTAKKNSRVAKMKGDSADSALGKFQFNSKLPQLAVSMR